ncbi:MAG: hypothetical protein MUO63_18675, partial [Desulfobulbaceae bacterium]|nr:hypothetical protein [Desulfobulbaceae bacterium]
VIAAAVFSGAWAGFKKTAPVSAQEKMLFAFCQAARVWFRIDLRHGAVGNDFYGNILCAGEDFPGIGEIPAAFLDKNFTDMTCWIRFLMIKVTFF